LLVVKNISQRALNQFQKIPTAKLLGLIRAHSGCVERARD